VPMVPPGLPAPRPASSSLTSAPVANLPPRPGCEPAGALLEKAPNPSVVLGFEYSTIFSASTPDP
jgi:hypothetical protein